MCWAADHCDRSDGSGYKAGALSVSESCRRGHADRRRAQRGVGWMTALSRGRNARGLGSRGDRYGLKCGGDTSWVAIPRTGHTGKRHVFEAPFFCLLFFGRQRKVGAAPHRGDANRPKAKQGKAKAKTASARKNPNATPPKGQTQPQINRTTKDKTILSNKVDIKGKGYSFPPTRRVTSPGNLPMPTFLSQGQHLDKTATATKVVSSQRIMTSRSKRM
ncbi:hypothetical protein R52603_03382 [Paraburkholderia saeva]|nr:hypothetical protein R52603_03382 [Paraburkholderia saeva]